MPKSQTVWSNNITKSQSSWANNDIKPATSWRSQTAVPTPYLYDSSSMRYDDAARAYDYLTPVPNTLNTLNPTIWRPT